MCEADALRCAAGSRRKRGHGEDPGTPAGRLAGGRTTDACAACAAAAAAHRREVAAGVDQQRRAAVQRLRLRGVQL